jgi:hypothetical protein
MVNTRGYNRKITLIGRHQRWAGTAIRHARVNCSYDDDRFYYDPILNAACQMAQEARRLGGGMDVLRGRCAPFTGGAELLGQATGLDPATSEAGRPAVQQAN